MPSKQTIVEVASTSGDRDILYSYVANENDHTVVRRSLECLGIWYLENVLSYVNTICVM